MTSVPQDVWPGGMPAVGQVAERSRKCYSSAPAAGTGWRSLTSTAPGMTSYTAPSTAQLTSASTIAGPPRAQPTVLASTHQPARVTCRRRISHCSSPATTPPRITPVAPARILSPDWP